MPSVGALLALSSALVWGAGDFCGGFATRRGNQFQVLALAALAGVVMLVGMAVFAGEPMPPVSSLAWAASAGMMGSVGIAALYQGLAVGSAATVAPTAAVITAALPVIFAALTAGLPRLSQIGGFAIAIGGIWLVARAATDGKGTGAGLKLALVAGCGFGGFLILIAQVESHLVFGPLVVTRLVTLVAATVLMRARGVRLPSFPSNPPALLAGLLDAGGNVFYLMARQHTRVDVAAVLSSLYPVATVFLARMVSNEPITRAQWVGVGLCLVAVALITV